MDPILPIKVGYSIFRWLLESFTQWIEVHLIIASTLSYPQKS